MALSFEEGVQLEPPGRTNVIVRDDDLIELEQDGAGLAGSLSQFASAQQTLELAGLLIRAVQAALTPEGA